MTEQKVCKDCVCPHGCHSASIQQGRQLIRRPGGEQAKPAFAQSVFIFRTEVVRVFCYSDYFHGDLRTDVVQDFCTITLGFYGVLTNRLSMVLQFDVSEVFRISNGDMTPRCLIHTLPQQQKIFCGKVYIGQMGFHTSTRLCHNRSLSQSLHLPAQNHKISHQNNKTSP